MQMNPVSRFDSLPDAARVRVAVVATLYGVSIPTIWRWARARRIPAPHKHVGTTAWTVGDLRRSLKEAA